MKQAVLFAIVGATLIALAAIVMFLLFEASDARRAILISAFVALIVQLLGFALIKAMPKDKLFIGWTLGAGLRFVVLIVFALTVVGRFGLPSTPALVSLALFLFVSTLVEPLFLKS